MYTIDLFETPGTGSDPRTGAAYIPSAPGKPGSRQRALGNANLAMLIKAINTPGTPPVTLNFLDGRSYTLKPKDLNLIADYYEKELDNEVSRINFIYRTLTSYNKTIKLLNTLSQGTLFEADKDLDFKSTKLSRLATQARAQFPDASSDLEALAAFFVTHQQDDADKIQKLNTQYQKQSDIIKKNQALDSEQQKVLRNIQREIDNVEQENDSLQNMQQQMVAANDRLRQQLEKMQQKRKDREEPAAQQKLAVPQAPEVAKEPEEPKAKRVAKAPAPKARTPRRTKAEIAKDRASQQAFAQAAKGLAQTPTDTTADEPTDLEKSAAADAIQRAQATARAATAAKAQQHFPGVVPSLRQPAEVDEVHDIASGQMGAMIEDELDEALPAKAMKQLYHWKNQRGQEAPEVAKSEPQPVAYQPRLQDLQAKKQKIENLVNIKKEIEALQARATRGGRILPRGLAADLEDYFTVSNVDTDYEDMLSKYQKQLGALQTYLGMRKTLWAPKKDVHEQSKLDRSGQKMYQAQESYMIVHNGKEVAFYKPSEMKQAYADAEGLANKFGGEVHVRKVMREGRSGYNPLTSEEHWKEVKNHLTKLLSTDMPYADKQVIRQRYLEKQKEAQQKGWEK